MTSCSSVNVSFQPGTMGVGSFAELRDVPVGALKQGTSITVSGRLLFNDGLGGVFIWNPGSLKPDNDATVIKPNTPLATGRWFKVGVVDLGTQTHIVKTYVDELPGIQMGEKTGAGTTNSAILAAAWASGTKTIYLPHDSLIRLANTSIPSGCALIGDRGAVVKMAAENFTNSNQNTGDPTTGRYSKQAIALDASGTTGVTMENFTIQSEVQQGRYLGAVLARLSSNIRLGGIVVENLPLGVGFRLSGITGDSYLDNCIARNFLDNTSWTVLPQSTGIEIDNDLLSSQATQNLRIHNCQVHDILLGTLAQSNPAGGQWGNQTDGVNVVSRDANGITLTDFQASRVGEGVDWFGKNGTISNLRTRECSIFGLKFIHGASNNTVSGGVITDTGLAGIVITGSRTSTVNTDSNIITGMSVVGVNFNSTYEPNSTACVLISNNSGSSATELGLPTNNMVTGCTLVPGTLGKYGWLDGTHSGSNNIGEGLMIGSSRSRKILIQRTTAAGGVRLAGTTTYQTNLT